MTKQKPSSISLIEIPYRADSAFFVEQLQDMPFCIYFDSGVTSLANARSGRYDIFSAAPLYSLRYQQGQLLRSGPDGNSSQAIRGKDLTDHLNHTLAAERLQKELPAHPLPFYGGFAGYFGYELYRYWEGHHPDSLRCDDHGPGTDLPDLLLGFYPWAGVVDHTEKRAWLSFLPSCHAALRTELQQRLCNNASTFTPINEYKKFKLINKLQSKSNVNSYKKKVERIQEYILAGDCYQVNLARQFSGRYRGSPWAAYLHLRKQVTSPFCCYFEFNFAKNLPIYSIMCFSPERFIELRGKRVLTQPIKGTAPRHPDPRTDQQNASALLASEKNRAENLMIVDLLRNDLGKCCEYGSVKTEKLFELQSFSSVHHLVSTVSATLRAPLTAFDLLQATLPGGSITGAPKSRAVDIIHELEDFQRTIYCGAMGYININGDMDSNIAIRTLLCHGERDQDGYIDCWAGGGIVADSQWEQEYQETFDKVGALLKGLGEPDLS